MATASEEALRAIFEQIRDERKTHANTATRIGDAFLSLLSHLDNGTFLKQGDTESREYILSVTGGASASLTKLFTLETVTEQGEERVTLATPLAPFKELELRDYLQIGDARLRWDSERQALYVTGKDGSTPVGFYSTGWLSAKGANDTQGEGGGGGGVSYSRLDSWEGYSDEEKGGWVLSAYLGVRLHQDIENLKNGVAMSYAVTGTGNAITDVTRDGSRWVFTKGKTFSELWHTHTLSDISNLHSSWDALLKAAPSAYVTRWPTAAEVGALTQTTADSRYALKTVTITAGAGLSGGGNLSANRTLSLAAVGTAGTYTKVTVDAYGRVTAHASLSAADIPTLSISKISGLQAALDKKLEATAFNELFEKVTLADGTTAIRAKYGLFSDEFLSAKGANDGEGEGGGGGGLAYSRLDTWEGYSDEEQAGWVLSAYLGVRLYKDVNELKQGAAISYVTQGTGNAVTDVTKLNGQLVFTRGKTFSELGHTHPLSNIYDLHANWDAILKAAPSAYVTRWPTAAEVGALTQATADSRYALKTVTITAGAGLSGGGNLSANRTLSLAAVGTAGTYTKVTVDAYGRVTAHASLSAADIPTLAISKISGLQAALDKKLEATAFNELFEKVTLADGTTAIRAKYGLYTDSFLSAKGANDSEGEGGGVAYNRLDTWDGYSEALAGWVLSAGLGYSLYTDVKSLKQGAAVSLVTTGSGNAVTDIAKSGTKLTVTKGLAFLTAHQNIFPLTIQGNGTSLAKYTPNSAALTVNITPANIGAAAASHSHSQYLTSVSLATINDLHSSWDAVLKAQKPNWLTSVSLATISDLHSSWDAVLKAQKPNWLTAHQAIYALTLQGNGSTIGTYNPKSAAATINLTAETLRLGRGNVPPQTGRTQNYGWLYSYNCTGSTPGDRPATYMSAVGFGVSTGGTVEIAGGWTSPMGLWYRALRDYEDDWYSWRKLLDSVTYTEYTVTKTGGGASGTWGIGISGNAATASKWAAKRTITLTGAVTGSVSLDGSGNVSLATTYATGNISALDSRYVNVSGDTMTGPLNFANATWNRVGDDVYIGDNNQAGSLCVKAANTANPGLAFYNNSNTAVGKLLVNGTTLQWQGNTLWHAGNDGSGSGLDADTLDGWHGVGTSGSVLRKSGYVTSGTAGLSSYWGKLASFSWSGQYDDQDITLYLHSAFNGWYAIVALRGRWTSATSVLASVKIISGNISPDTLRLYYDPSSVSGTLELWCDVGGQYNVFNAVVLSETRRTTEETGRVTLYRNLFSTAQTLPSRSYVSGEYVGIKNNAATAAQLLTARTINGTSFNGTANITTAKWGTARSIYIRDASQAHTGAAVSVDGSANEYLLLPATITATLSGNASSASKAAQLTTARTLWGQSFNGTGNVSGNLSGVGSISASGNFSTSKATNTYLAGNQGQALVNSTAAAGAYVMLHRGCSTNGYFTLGTYQGTYLLQYTAKSTVTAGTNSVTKSVTLLNEAGNSSFPGSLYAKTGLYSDGYVSAKGQNTSSDMRLKRVLRDVRLPLGDIANAPSFLFSWKKSGLRDVGSSAQYWRGVLPEAVKERGGWLEMAYGNLALLSAISIARETLRLDRRVALLEEENRRLRGRVARLEGAGTRHLSRT